MKSIRLALVIALLAGAGAACAFHIPWETMDDYDGVRVVMRVTPDDADVLLNGRFIGAAYEYADSRAALRLAHKGYVLETGTIVLSGPASELLADERVRKAYLGEG